MRPPSSASVVLRAAGAIGAALFTLACAFDGEAQAGRVCTAVPPAATTGRLLVASQSGSVALVDLASGSVARLNIGGELHGAAVSPDGRWGVVTDYGRRRRSEYPARVFDGNTLLIIDLAQGRLARRVDIGEHRGVHDVAFVPGSPTRVVVTAQGNREIVTVDLESGAVLAAVDTRGEGTHSLAIAADGRTVYGSNEEEETVSRIDLASGTLLGHLSIGANPLGVAVTPDGSELWVGSRDGTVRVLDAQTGALKTKIEAMGFVDDLTFTPDGRRAVILDGRRALHVVDAARRSIVGSVPLTRPSKLTLSPDGRVAFVSLYTSAEVAVVDLAVPCVVRRYDVGAEPDGLGWTPVVAPNR